MLERISYYRLSSYWYPFLADKEIKKFKENATFNSAFKIYKFDRKFRKIVFADTVEFFIFIASTKYAKEMARTCESYGLKKGVDFWMP